MLGFPEMNNSITNVHNININCITCPLVILCSQAWHVHPTHKSSPGQPIPRLSSHVHPSARGLPHEQSSYIEDKFELISHVL